MGKGIKPMIKAAGSGQFIEGSKIMIRMVNRGCTNRPFWHIIAQEYQNAIKTEPIEQLGSVDMMPNERDERLVALNIDRITYWLSEGAICTKPVTTLLGQAGFLPITPETYMRAWRRRKQLAEQMNNAEKPNES